MRYKSQGLSLMTILVPISRVVKVLDRVGVPDLHRSKGSVMEGATGEGCHLISSVSDTCQSQAGSSTMGIDRMTETAKEL